MSTVEILRGGTGSSGGKVTDRPIIFSAPMVLALREGRKTQTRRTRGMDRFNIVPNDWGYRETVLDKYDRTLHVMTHLNGGEVKFPCPYGVEGDQLWVRETWQDTGDPEPWCMYRADSEMQNSEATRRGCLYQGPWRPSIFMPRHYSRDTLEVISARPERLHAITEADAIAEGFGPRSAIALFRGTWSVINGPDSWAKNPWIWRVAFKRLEAR